MWFKLDALVSGLNGVAYLLLAGLLDDALGLPAGLLRAVGAFLIGFAAFVVLRPGRVVVALNAVWALDSLVLAAVGWQSPTAVGLAWIVAQGLVVGALAVLQAQSMSQSTMRSSSI